MTKKELTDEIRGISGVSCNGIAKWLAEMSHPTIFDYSNVELSADGKHLFVWHRRTPGVDMYELTSHELYMMNDIVGVPKGKHIATPHGIRFAA